MKSDLRKLITAHCSLITVFLLFDIAPCFAGAEIHPRISVREEYNDNVYLDPRSERQGDFITTVAPGVSAQVESRHLHLDLDYGLRFRIYEELEEENETSPGEAQRALARATLFPGRDFTLNVLEEYTRVAVDPREPLVEESDTVNTSNLNRLTVNPEYTLARRSWSATLGYQFEHLDYDAPEGDDSRAHRGTLDLAKRLSSRLTLFGAFAGEDREMEAQRDYLRTDASGGVTWQPGGRLQVTVSGGWAWIDFAEEVEGLGGEEGTQRTATWRAEGRWEIRPALVGSLAYGETVELSTNEGLYESRSADGSLNYEGKVGMQLTAWGREDEYLSVNRLDRAVGIGLSVGIPLGGALVFDLGADLERLAFHPGDEDAWRYRAATTLGYARKRFTAGAGYRVSGENSDVDANDYLNNVVYVEGGFRF